MIVLIFKKQFAIIPVNPVLAHKPIIVLVVQLVLLDNLIHNPIHVIVNYGIPNNQIIYALSLHMKIQSLIKLKVQ
jgi:hypothetical protein